MGDGVFLWEIVGMNLGNVQKSCIFFDGLHPGKSEGFRTIAFQYGHHSWGMCIIFRPYANAKAGERE